LCSGIGSPQANALGLSKLEGGSNSDRSKEQMAETRSISSAAPAQGKMMMNEEQRLNRDPARPCAFFPSVAIFVKRHLKFWKEIHGRIEATIRAALPGAG
jgi:hypothetical protein